MRETIRADAALLAAVEAGDGATLHTDAGAVVSWPAVHLLAAHGFRWAPSDDRGGEGGPSGTRLHVESVIEHAPRADVVLGMLPVRFLKRATGVEPRSSLAEGTAALEPTRLTAMAERRSPHRSTFVVTGDGVGGVLTVERSPHAVLETLRCTVAVTTLVDGADGLGALRDGLEAGLWSVARGGHLKSAQFATSRGRIDGVVDTMVLGPPTPLGVFSGPRDARSARLAARRQELGGHTIGLDIGGGVVFWFRGSERDRWAAAASLTRRLADDPAPDDV